MVRAWGTHHRENFLLKIYLWGGHGMVGSDFCLPGSITRVAWVVVVRVVWTRVLVLEVLVRVSHRSRTVPIRVVGHALVQGVPWCLQKSSSTNVLKTSEHSYRGWRRVVPAKKPAESEPITNELPVKIVEVVGPERVQLGLQVGRGVVRRRVGHALRQQRLLLQTIWGRKATRYRGVPT